MSPAPVSRRLLGLLAGLTLLLHLATARGYGYFRRATLGTSLHALRLVPALAAAAPRRWLAFGLVAGSACSTRSASCSSASASSSASCRPAAWLS